MDCVVERPKRNDAVQTVYCGKKLSIQETRDPYSPENDEPLTRLRRINGQLLETWVLFPEIGTAFVTERSKTGDAKSYQGLPGVC